MDRQAMAMPPRGAHETGAHETGAHETGGLGIGGLEIDPRETDGRHERARFAGHAGNLGRLERACFRAPCPGRSRGWTWLALVLVMGLAGLAAGGCGEGPDGSGGQVNLQLAPSVAAADAGAKAKPILCLPVIDGFTSTGSKITARMAEADFKYTDAAGEAAALLRVSVTFGEPDQSLDAKFKSIVDETRVIVKNAASFQPQAAPEKITTGDGIPGEIRTYTYLDESGNPQLYAFALLDLRRTDAAYVRVQMLTPKPNWKKLGPRFAAFLNETRRVAP
ncbi:MAG: hypothetical protein ACREJ2_17985 [Planctomycetota bacterium]